MGVGGGLQMFLLFAATAILLVLTLSTPIIRRLTFMQITTNATTLRLGVLGYCNSQRCSSKHIGYDLSAVVRAATNNNNLKDHYSTLTKSLVMVPISCIITGVAFLISLCSQKMGYCVSGIVSLFAFISTLAALICESVLFAALRDDLRRNTSARVSNFGIAHWLLVAATGAVFLCPLLGMIECCTARSRSQKSKDGQVYDSVQPGYGYNMPLAAYPPPPQQGGHHV
ncbi:hypothetical protein Q8F55_000153 [Vanrija albida]|uniref:Pali-domain-containing protein n=1 Tax=Vanrija albida TaxID=181172 RepID=A0ABR3QCI0_9TREE